MKIAFCTISTISHVFKTQALRFSVLDKMDLNFHCLLIDGNENNTDINFDYLDDLKDNLSQKIKAKYKKDKLRWALKPLYLKFLIEQGYDKVIYCDNDIFFFESPAFLYEKLDKNSFLLTPHWYSHNPKIEQNWLEANYTVGLYNAGFIGVNKNAISALNWWAECCLYNVKKSFSRGLFDDQKYLDLIPVIFEKVEVVKHKGCNVAGWNTNQYIISKKDNTILINDNYPLIFIHFTPLSFRVFSIAKHSLNKHLNEYINTLKSYNPSYSSENTIARSYKDYLFYIRFLFWKIKRFLE